MTARLRWPQGLNRDPSWRVNAWLQTPVPHPPENVLGDTQALTAWQALPEVKAALANRRSFTLAEDADGAFSAEDVPPGEYMFSATVVALAATPGPATIHARAAVSVNVPSDPPSGTVDLGEVLLKAGP